MRRFGKTPVRSCLALLCGLQASCSALSPEGPARSPLCPAPVVAARLVPEAQPAYQRVRFTVRGPDEPPAAVQPAPPDAPAPLFAGQAELSVEALVQEVLSRNPSVGEMVAAWEAAQARYPQVTSLDDPLFGTTLAPAAVGREPNNGYRFEVFQRYQWPGKLRLRGENAAAEANAAGRDVDNIRLQLVESARDAFYEYYLVYRGLEVNAEALSILRSALKAAKRRFENTQGTEQDVLQLQVEVGRQRERELVLDRQRSVSVARINTLLHQSPTLPLPPPPRRLQVEGELPDPCQLRTAALTQRLDLLQLQDRIVAARASVDLARREYYPDFDVMGAYDTFWSDNRQRAQLGVRVNLPVRRARRNAAVKEAEARLAQLQAELVRQTDQAGFEVQEAYEQWRESLRTVRLFDEEVLPPARLNVKAARSLFATGGVSLLVLLDAERNLVNLEDRYYEATAAFFQRRTALQRSLTGTPSRVPLPMPAPRPQPGQPGAPAGMGRQ